MWRRAGRAGLFGVAGGLAVAVKLNVQKNYSALRERLIPTSNVLLVRSLDTLLKRFVETSDVETFSTEAGIHVTKVTARGGAQNENNQKPKKKLVVCHGYGAGSGLFYKNYDALADIYDVYALDWPGFGVSPRDHKSIPYVRSIDAFLQKAADKGGRAAPAAQARVRDHSKTIDYFVDALESWRQEMDFHDDDKVVLAGHSMGGYLAAHYALKYPDSLDSLVLLSPAGIQERPLTSVETMRTRPMYFNALAVAWRANVTPMALIRASAHYGPGMVANAVHWRFKHSATEEEIALLGNYMYHISAAPGAGEYFLNSFLDPVAYATPAGKMRYGMFAKAPLHKVLGSAATRCKVPTLVLYGNKDWLDYEGVEKDVEAWGQAGSDVTLLRVNNGGHNFFLENPEGFHEHMRGWEAKEKERDAAAVV